MSNGTLKIGSESPNRIYIGADEVDKIYQGQDLIWIKPPIYGWHVDPTISDPYQAVTYLADARNKESASLYRQVEYLKSTGTQYILTDIIPFNTTKIKLDMQFGDFHEYANASTYNSYFCGVTEFGGDTTSEVFWGTSLNERSDSTNFDFFLGNVSWQESSTHISSPANITTRQTMQICRGDSYWGNQTALVNAAVTKAEPTKSLAIMGFNCVDRPNFSSNPYKCRDLIIYGVKIYINGSDLSHNLIPVERSYDKELGLYDTITNKFYTNTGTGTFEKGSYVDNSIFDYGDWKNAFFMPKPCMLRYDGTVAYYLDPNDYTKKADGTASDVANASYDGNAMMEWPRIWYKFESLEDKGYRAVEYLRSTGTQYIQTDIIPNYQMKIESNIALGDTYQAGGHGGIFGTIANNRRFAFLISMNGNLPRVYGYYGYPWSSPDSDFSFDSSWSSLSPKNLWKLSHSEISVGSTVKTNLPAISQDPVENSLTIFAMINTGSVLRVYSLSNYMTVYDFKIYDEGNNLIHNLIPVERISDNELGLYDVITNKFYSNAGTGTFEKGSYVDGHGFFYCSSVKVDSSYKCWCNINANDEIIPHFYTAIYNGTGTAKLRSLSGVQLTSANGNGNVDTNTEINRAEANNTTTSKEWYIDVISDRLLINALLVLMSKTLNTRAAYGIGYAAGTQSLKESYVTGSLNDKGLFYGKTSSADTAVKVFGMENWWGCVFRRTAGLLNVNSDYYIKLTRGTADGSTASDYSFESPSGYLVSGIKSPSDPGHIKKMAYSSFGGLPTEINATIDTYYCSWLAYWKSANITHYSLTGGMIESRMSAMETDYTLSATHAYTISSCLSCKPMKS